MTEHDFDQLHWRRLRRRRIAMVLVITMVAGGALAYVRSCSQQVTVPDFYEPKDVGR